MADKYITSRFGLDVPQYILDARKEEQEYRSKRLKVWVEEDWDVEFGSYVVDETFEAHCHYCECSPEIEWVVTDECKVSDLSENLLILRDYEDDRSYMWRPPQDEFDGRPISDSRSKKLLKIDTSSKARDEWENNFPNFRMEGLEVEYFKPEENDEL